MVLNWVRCLLLLGALGAGAVWAQDISLMPKYGGGTKTALQLEADASFLKSMDKNFDGDRLRASEEVARFAWQALRQGRAVDAARRFNQAWLLNPKNGMALWGMGALESDKGSYDSAVKLFDEASAYLQADPDFRADQARALGFIGLETKDQALQERAWRIFEDVKRSSPGHAVNLQNWAIVLYYGGRFQEAWQKIAEAEKTPNAKDINPAFLKALGGKMPRP